MSTKTVLLVEDHPGDRDMYGKILWYNGYDVIYATDGEAGLRMAHEAHPDLIILDLELPLLHGSKLASQLKQDENTSDIPLVALTGRRLSDFGGNASILGYAKFLEKPVSPLEVLHEVEQLIGRVAVDQSERPQPPRVVRTITADAQEQTQQQKMARQLLADIPPVLARWEDLVRAEPWFSLPREHRMSNLGDVVAAIAEAALLTPNDSESNRKVVLAAATHGGNRSAQGIPESLIPIEYHLLRRALWHYVNDTFPPSEEAYSAVTALDQIVTLALNASMWGYYRDDVVEDGWEIAINRLIEGHEEARTRRAQTT